MLCTPGAQHCPWSLVVPPAASRRYTSTSFPLSPLPHLQSSLIQSCPCRWKRSRNWSIRLTMRESSFIADRSEPLYSRGDSVVELRLFTAVAGKSIAACGQRTRKEAERFIGSPGLLRLLSHTHTGSRAYMETRVQHTGCAVLSGQVSCGDQRVEYILVLDRLEGNI